MGQQSVPIALTFTGGFRPYLHGFKKIILYDFETIPSHSHGLALVIIY